jgi:hypothetical protein
MLGVIIFPSNKQLWLVCIYHRGMMGNATVSRKEEASTAIIPTIYRTSFHDVYNQVHNRQYQAEHEDKLSPFGLSTSFFFQVLLLQTQP